MKKFFLIFIPIILILTYIFYQNNLLPHPKYTNDDFGIQTYKSINDQDHDGIDDQSDIVQNVRKYIETKPQYKSKYYQGGYPTDHYGVCSDVVARCFPLGLSGHLQHPEPEGHQQQRRACPLAHLVVSNGYFSQPLLHGHRALSQQPRPGIQ